MIKALRTAVIILNWNTRKFLQDFLPSLVDSLEGLDAELVVADNGSSDDSVNFVKTHYPKLKLIELEQNYGFTGGYNRAIAQLLNNGEALEYLVLINSDILVQKGWIEPLIDHLDKNPACGVCAPKLLTLEAEGDGYKTTSRFEYAGAAGGYLDRFGFPFCRGRVLNYTEEDRGQYSSKSVFWVSGACIATRSSLWKALEGLDERFFAHMEEIDYCWRAQLSGFCIDALSNSAVYHLGGGSLDNSSAFKLKLNYRNSLLCLEKNLAFTLTPHKAVCRFRTRYLIDLCAAFAYRLSGKKEYAKAVSEAHREFKELSGGSADREVARRQIAAASLLLSRGTESAKTGEKVEREQGGRIGKNQNKRGEECESGAKVLGLRNIMIILQFGLRGKRVVEYLMKSE